MKIIFLDIDGVLNSTESMKRKGKHLFNDNPDPVHMKWLNYIIEKTGAFVVVSSVWRKGCGSTYLWRLFDLCGFKGRVIGKTPDLDDIRGNEIRAWLDRFLNDKNWQLKEEKKSVESFVIIDDDSDMGKFSDRLVKTKSEHGLTEKEAKEAVAMLNKNKAYYYRKY